MLKIIARMAEILRGFDSTEIEHSIFVIERDRVRRRRLPIA